MKPSSVLYFERQQLTLGVHENLLIRERGVTIKVQNQKRFHLTLLCIYKLHKFNFHLTLYTIGEIQPRLLK